MDNPELFKNHKYLFVPNLVSKEICQDVAVQFEQAIHKGIAKSGDIQCPSSYYLSRFPIFDKLLEDLKPHIESYTGLSLYPTYAYARWYAPGEDLKIHTDRESCEVSATITLAFEGNPWPIYMGYDKEKQNCHKVEMQVGDAVIYRGCEVFHWREKYTEGKWQAQIFVHYVDSNGPNARRKYDNQPFLANHICPQRKWVALKDSFSTFSCQKIIEQYEGKKDFLYEAELQGGLVNKELRNTKKIENSVFKGIGATLTGIGFNINRIVGDWKFDVTHSQQSEYLRYDETGHFREHIDTILNLGRTDSQRKLTVILFLNNDYEGGRLYLVSGDQKVYPPQEPGTVLVFPSFLSHGVEPITKGVRHSIVTWIEGPNLK